MADDDDDEFFSGDDEDDLRGTPYANPVTLPRKFRFGSVASLDLDGFSDAGQAPPRIDSGPRLPTPTLQRGISMPRPTWARLHPSGNILIQKMPSSSADRHGTFFSTGFLLRHASQKKALVA